MFLEFSRDYSGYLQRNSKLMTKPTLSVFTEITVRFHEVDSLGIVWHGHYLRYFEDGREAFGKKYQVGYADFAERGYAVPVVHVHCSYKHPLRYGENIKVITTLVNSLSAKLIFDYQILNSEGRLAATGQTTQVLVEKDTNLLCLVLPEFLVQWKMKHGLM
ncbi:MAG: 4-hydroxybenzoyl-CoA thioesterase [Chitinophagales bacterium]|nr:MAG: 4-hydroxybenzoyl-CoA thioesterase [Chitinophagales bacterium]